MFLGSILEAVSLEESNKVLVQIVITDLKLYILYHVTSIYERV